MDFTVLKTGVRGQEGLKISTFAFGQKWCCNMGGAFFTYARIRAFFGFIMRKIKTKTYKTICIWSRNAAL